MSEKLGKIPTDVEVLAAAHKRRQVDLAFRLIILRKNGVVTRDFLGEKGCDACPFYDKNGLRKPMFPVSCSGAVNVSQPEKLYAADGVIKLQGGEKAMDIDDLLELANCTMQIAVRRFLLDEKLGTVVKQRI